MAEAIVHAICVLTNKGRKESEEGLIVIEIAGKIRENRRIPSSIFTVPDTCALLATPTKAQLPVVSAFPSISLAFLHRLRTLTSPNRAMKQFRSHRVTNDVDGKDIATSIIASKVDIALERRVT